MFRSPSAWIRLRLGPWPRWSLSRDGWFSTDELRDDILDVLVDHSLSTDSYDALEELKDIFRLASLRTRARMRDRSLKRREVEFHYLIAAWKAARAGDIKGFRRAASVVGLVLDFVTVIGDEVFIHAHSELLACIKSLALDLESERESQEIAAAFSSEVKTK